MNKISAISLVAVMALAVFAFAGPGKMEQRPPGRQIKVQLCDRDGHDLGAYYSDTIPRVGEYATQKADSGPNFNTKARKVLGVIHVGWDDRNQDVMILCGPNESQPFWIGVKARI